MGRADLENLDQEAELEHIQDYKLNGFKGELIAKDLRELSDLWGKVWMDTSPAEGSWGDNGYQYDVLHLLTPNKDHASRLVEFLAIWYAKGSATFQEKERQWLVSGKWSKYYVSRNQSE